MTLSQRPLTLFAAVSLGTVMLVPSIADGQALVCPRPVVTRLAMPAGRWRVDWSYLLDGQLRTVEQSTATIDIAAGGCAVRERLEGQL